MKAIAKHNCSVLLTTSLDSISLNRTSIAKGQVIELPVEKVTNHAPDSLLHKHFGDKEVIFRDGIWLMPTYSNDFDYEE